MCLEKKSTKDDLLELYSFVSLYKKGKEERSLKNQNTSVEDIARSNPSVHSKVVVLK